MRGLVASLNKSVMMAAAVTMPVTIGVPMFVPTVPVPELVTMFVAVTMLEVAVAKMNHNAIMMSMACGGRCRRSANAKRHCTGGNNCNQSFTQHDEFLSRIIAAGRPARI
jgi:hypothetical protein